MVAHAHEGPWPSWRRLVGRRPAHPLPPTQASRRSVARAPAWRGSAMPLSGVECTMDVPLAGVEWHDIS